MGQSIRARCINPGCVAALEAKHNSEAELVGAGVLGVKVLGVVRSLVRLS